HTRFSRDWSSDVCSSDLVLPFAKRRMVGPYIFFDRMGPKRMAPGLPLEADVRPHPHIGLSTITYLFDGEIMHRDSLASEQPIRRSEERRVGKAWRSRWST